MPAGVQILEAEIARGSTVSSDWSDDDWEYDNYGDQWDDYGDYGDSFYGDDDT